MNAPAPTSIVRHYLVPPDAEAASRADWIARQVEWHRMSRPEPQPFRGGRLLVAAVLVCWGVVWLAWRVM